MAAEKKQILAKGIRFFDKNPSSPDFVLGSVVLTEKEIIEMFKEQSEYVTEYNGLKQLRLPMLKSREGKTYFSVDTYKKEGQQSATQSSQPSKAAPYQQKNTFIDNDASDQLPF